MKTLYRNSFTIFREEADGELVDSIADEFWDWVFKWRGGKGSFFPPENKPKGICSLKKLTGRDGASLEALQTTDESGKITFGFSFKHPDARQSEIEWISEAGLVRESEDECTFSFSLMVAKRDGSFSPVDREPSCPNLLKDIIGKYKCSNKLRLTAKPVYVTTEDETKKLYNFIRDTDRKHPILFVSKHVQSDSHLFDYRKTAENLCGLVYVVVARNLEISIALSKMLPTWHTCFDGAARLYWPGYRPFDEATKHPLWIGSRIITMNQYRDDVFAHRVLRRVSEVFSYHTTVDFLSWGKILEFDRKRAIRAAIDANELAELLKLYEEDNTRLSADVESLKIELASKTEENHQLKIQIDSFEQVFEARKSGSEDLEAAESQIPVSTVDEAMERAKNLYANELVFALNSKSTKSGSPFQPAQEILQAFQWIATTFRESRMGKATGQNHNLDVREKIPSWSFSPRQTSGAVGSNKEWYQCQHKGTTYDIHEHLKSGTSRKAEESIRIAFTYCPNIKKVIIGFIGQHQRNKNT